MLGAKERRAWRLTLVSHPDSFSGIGYGTATTLSPHPSMKLVIEGGKFEPQALECAVPLTGEFGAITRRKAAFHYVAETCVVPADAHKHPVGHSLSTVHDWKLFVHEGELAHWLLALVDTLTSILPDGKNVVHRRSRTSHEDQRHVAFERDLRSVRIR